MLQHQSILSHRCSAISGSWARTQCGGLAELNQRGSGNDERKMLELHCSVECDIKMVLSFSCKLFWWDKLWDSLLRRVNVIQWYQPSLAPVVILTTLYLGYSVSPWKSYFGIRLFVMSIVPNVLLCPMEVPDTPLFLIMPLSTQSMCKRKAVLLFDLRLAGWPTPAAAQENQEHTYNFTYPRY